VPVPTDRPPASSSAPKAARIWKRTWFGAIVAGGTAFVLWLAHRMDDPRPVLHAGAIVTFIAIAEVSLMGALARRNLPAVLCVPLIFVALCELAALRPTGDTSFGTQLALEYAWAGVLAAIVQAFSSALATRPRLRQIVLVVCTLALAGLFAWLDARDLGPRATLPALGVAALVAVLVSLPTLRSRASRVDLAIAVGLAMWMLVPLPALAQVTRRFHVEGLVALIALSKIGDIAGYYAGNAWGKTHPFPRLSPGKTTAGCVASLVAAVALGMVLVEVGWLAPRAWGIAAGALAGMAVNLAAQAGDLLESFVKRRAGVKDSSTWMGPAGGVLDVIDSLLLSVPAALLSWPHLLA
jgi:CDP-diglyceride synthetase